MKVIEINSNKHGKFNLLLDDEDYDIISKYKLYIFKSRQFVYACRAVYNKETKKQSNIFIHREIMNCVKSGKNVFVDHIDHNGLNCQKSNLRLCTNRQNQMNKIPTGKSKYLGVWYNRNSIVSKIRVNREQIYLGVFETEEDAAKAYDEAAKKYHGEFANLNFK